MTILSKISLFPKPNKLNLKKEINLTQPTRNPVKSISVQHIFPEKFVITVCMKIEEPKGQKSLYSICFLL